MIEKKQVSEWFMGLQDDICNSLSTLDGAPFREDLWDRPEGGGGRSRVMESGNIFEKGGVNFSAVHGPTPEKILKALDIPKSDFFATGVSIVIHPDNPWVPIIHMNVRYFQMSNGVSWFGGGIDLTPHYIQIEDAQFFHQELKKVCDHHHLSYYEEFKRWADDYFYIKHRKETRGIGGIFFDRLSDSEEFSMKQRYDFIQDVGRAFVPIYSELVERNMDKNYEPAQKEWQKLRRGRYVEFNLVLDKGTKFGLDTDGRTESILMSLPPLASWKYDHHPEKGSPEDKTLSLLKKGIDWIDL
jgi:coproporphyrinogen III oxidase